MPTMLDLPEGVIRCQQACSNVSWDECSAIQFYIEPTKGEVERSLIVWRDGPKNIRPFDSNKRLRDLRPGDIVWFFDEMATLTGVELYR